MAQQVFVLWVLVGAAWGFAWPEIASTGKDWIPEMLSAVMLAMGLTLKAADIIALRHAGRPVMIGVTLQFLVMPLCAWGLADALELPHELAIGIILVGAAPGGTASNVVAYLARGDVALSVAMTTTSTLLAPLLTPLWVWLLASAWLPIEPMPLFLSMTKIVLLPVLIGVGIRALWKPSSLLLEGVLPLLSMFVIAWIVGVITGLNHARMTDIAVSLIASVIALNAAGLLLGHLGAAHDGLSVRSRRTVAIEVGMQNSGLAVALAIAHFSPLTALPGALFSLWHNITGPLLASIWRRNTSLP